MPDYTEIWPHCPIWTILCPQLGLSRDRVPTPLILSFEKIFRDCRYVQTGVLLIIRIKLIQLKNKFEIFVAQLILF